jgi:hypothetical protein
MTRLFCILNGHVWRCDNGNLSCVRCKTQIAVMATPRGRDGDAG